jgi:arginase
VLDPSVGRANWFAEDGGLSVDEVAAAVDEVAARFTISAAALTAYQPECDPEGAVPPAARTIFARIAAGAQATVSAG